MNIFADYLSELGLEAGKEFLIDKRKDGEIRERIHNYVERQRNINEICDLAEEIDFEGLTKYISSELLDDVKVYLFGNKQNRENMKKTILIKAYSYSNANDKRNRDRVEKVLNGSLDILYNFYRMQIDNNDWFVSAEIIDSIEKMLREGEKNILNAVNNQKLMNEINKTENNVNKIYDNTLFQNLHEFIIKNYIKERYRKQKPSGQDLEIFSDLFKLCIDVFDNEKKVEINKNIFDFVREDILTQKQENLIKIEGPDGTGKSTFLSILYIYLYLYCEKNGFSFCPFYINLHYYDIVIDDITSNNQAVKDKMYDDLQKLKCLVQIYPDIPYIIIIDGNENYFRTTLKSANYFNEFIKEISAHKKIVCIGEKTNVHAYRERKVYPYMYARMNYTFKFKSINKYEVEKWDNFIKYFTYIEKNEKLLGEIKNYLDKFDLEEVDLNVLNVFKDCYDSDVLKGLNSISDLYKNYCMAYLKDMDDFEDSAKMSYEYFMTSKKFSQNEIANNNKKWNLVHQHKTISNFLIAYYFVSKVKNYNGKKEIKCLEFLFPMDVNIFIKPLINENLEIQELVFDKCKQIYFEGKILAKSQALYMMGRITNKIMKADILAVLEGYYDNIHKQLEVPGDSKGRDLQLLLRSVIISLVYLGKKDKREEYLKMLLNYPIANQINRGFHLEYYGDILRKPDNRIYNYNDDGTGNIDITYNMLLNRIKHYLTSVNGTEDLNFQINLFTLCSLIQVRLGKNNLPQEYIHNFLNP